MHWTPFAGLTALDPGDSIALDGGSFLYANPTITDHFVRIGAVAHRHDQHPGLPNPQAPMTANIVASGGALAADATYALTYTVVDQDGGETLPAPATVVETGPATDDPTVAPTAVGDYTQGIMPAGTFYYALTYTDGQGGETGMGPYTSVVIAPGNASGAVDLSGLAAELSPNGAGVTWRLWRSDDASDWHLVLEGVTDTYVDSGFDPPDNPAVPPAANTTGGVYSILATLPGDDPALITGAYVNVYLALDTGFASPSFYGQYALPDAAGMSIAITLDATTDGAPPHVSTSIPGAHQIYPDTELQFGFKLPVATWADLPAGALGDVRITLDTGQLWVVRKQGGAVDPGDWSSLGPALLGSPVVDVYAADGAGFVEGLSRAFSGELSPLSSGAASAAVAVVASPDGTNVYVATTTSGDAAIGIAIFRRAQDGTLTYLTSVDPGTYTWPGPRLNGDVTTVCLPQSMAFTSDGAYLYTQNIDDTISQWQRQADGTLTLLNTYPAYTDPTGTFFPGALPDVGVRTSSMIAVTPDDANVYAATGDHISQFACHADGSLAPLGSAQYTSGENTVFCDGAFVLLDMAQLSGGDAQGNVGLGAFSTALTVSPDSEHIYSVDGGSGAITHFTRNPDGTLNEVDNSFIPHEGPIGETMSAWDIVCSPDGTKVYGTAINYPAGDPADAYVWGATRAADGSLAMSDQVSVGETVNALAITPDGANIYTTLGQPYAAPDGATYTITPSIAVLGTNPLALVELATYDGASFPYGIAAVEIWPTTEIGVLEFVGAGGITTEIVDLGGGSARVVLHAASSIDSTQQSGDYQFTLADAGTVVEGTGSDPQTFTILASTATAFPSGTIIEVFQYGVGQITIAGAAEVTLRSDGGLVTTRGQYATIRLRQRAADEWVLSGDLA